MKTETQRSDDLAHVATLIEDIKIAMLTTLNADGTLSSRPMAALEMDASGALWFFTDANSAKLDRLEEMNLSFADTDNGTYVSLAGRGELSTNSDHIARLWTPMARPWFPDGPDSASLALLKFVPNSADYWDAPSSKMVRAFGALASVIVSKPVGMG